MLLKITQRPRLPTPQRITWLTLSIPAVLINPTKFSYKLVIQLYLASRKVENCSLYSERLYAYLKIRDSIIRKDWMDMMEGDCSSVPYSTSDQRFESSSLSPYPRSIMQPWYKLIPSITGQFLKQNQPFA